MCTLPKLGLFKLDVMHGAQNVLTCVAPAQLCGPSKRDEDPPVQPQDHVMEAVIPPARLADGQNDLRGLMQASETLAAHC